MIAERVRVTISHDNAAKVISVSSSRECARRVLDVSSSEPACPARLVILVSPDTLQAERVYFV